MSRILLPLISLFFFFNLSFGQEYVRLMEDKTSNFYDIQQAFNEHWDGKAYEKGKGWKQFKRWEYFMEPRVYPTGRIVDPSISYREHIRFQNQYGPQKGAINNKNSNWTPMGPTNWTNGNTSSPGLGRINAVTIDPNNSNIIYVGSPAGGCWKSTNAGNSWIPLTDNLGSLGVSGIAIDPNNSNNIYIATGDGDGNDTYSIGVMKSTDAGATWSATGLNWTTTLTRVMRKILIHPTNSNILWVATSNGLFKTTDAGVNWNSVASGSIRDIELNPANPNTIFICTNTEIYKSTNGGDNFTAASTGIPGSGIGRLSIAVTADDTNYVYVIATNDFDYGLEGIYRSTDGGNNYSIRSNSPNVMGWNTNGSDPGGQGWYDLALTVSPTNRNQIFTGGVNMWTSTNGGSSMTCLTKWNQPTGIYGYVHADIHTIDYYGNDMYCGSDGGIFKSTNNGASWSDLTVGIQHSQFYRMGASATVAGTILTGSQDNGTFMLDGGAWNHVRGGDGMECIVDYSNPNIMYASIYYGNVSKSTNGGNSFSNITNSISGDDGAWVTPYVQDPNNPNTLYLGYREIWKTTNGGGSWNSISNLSSGFLKSIAVAPSNSNYIYASTGTKIFRTTDGGSNWTDISAGLPLPSTVITYISVNNLDPNLLWITFSGYTAGEKVYKSVDGGNNWTNVSGILPNIPVNCVLFENGTNNGIYIGTDVGVYYKNDDLNFWQSYMSGLPNVIVNELEIHYPSGKLRAATFGRGLWESDVFLSNTPPIAQFSTPDTMLCPGHCATFSNNSINLGQNWTWYFPGATPSTSTDLNPTVCYPNVGNFNVSLVTTNSYGSDSAFIATYVDVQIPPAGIPLPLSEGFEGSSTIPSSWTIVNEDQAATWDHTASVGGFGLSNSSAFIDNFSTLFIGKKDYLITPNLDFTAASTPIMTFDVAYSEWTQNRSDTLAIYYSDDCGVTKNLLWEKDGTTLRTANNLPVLFTPTASEWRNDTVDLSAIIGLPSVDIYFENRSGFGNVIYIDNINIFEYINTGIGEHQLENVSLYPNPFENTLTILSNNAQIDYIEIYDAIGKRVFEEQVITGVKNHTINLEHLMQGFYLVKVLAGDEIITKNLIKR